MGKDKTVSMALVRISITIQVDYLGMQKVLAEVSQSSYILRYLLSDMIHPSNISFLKITRFFFSFSSLITFC